MRPTRLTGLSALVVAGLFISAGNGQEKKPFAPKSDALIHNSLRDVITTGADLFNLKSDYLGCYRLYQGSLIAVKPLLKPATQADVEKALAEAEKMTTFEEKANRLREVLDTVRDQTKPKMPAAAPTPPPQPPVLKKPAPTGELIRIPPKRVND